MRFFSRGEILESQEGVGERKRFQSVLDHSCKTVVNSVSRLDHFPRPYTKEKVVETMLATSDLGGDLGTQRAIPNYRCAGDRDKMLKVRIYDLLGHCLVKQCFHQRPAAL